MSLRRLEVLLYVYRRRQTTLQEIIRSLNLVPSSATKLVQSWSHLDQNKQPGPKYLVAEADPMNLSTKVIKITPRGAKAVELLLETQSGNQDTHDSVRQIGENPERGPIHP